MRFVLVIVKLENLNFEFELKSGIVIFRYFSLEARGSIQQELRFKSAGIHLIGYFIISTDIFIHLYFIQY